MKLPLLQKIKPDKSAISSTTRLHYTFPFLFCISSIRSCVLLVLVICLVLLVLRNNTVNMYVNGLTSLPTLHHPEELRFDQFG